MPRKQNFDHPADTIDERNARRRASDTQTNANTAREYGYPNIGRDLDRVAEKQHKQANDLASKRKTRR